MSVCALNFSIYSLGLISLHLAGVKRLYLESTPLAPIWFLLDIANTWVGL